MSEALFQQVGIIVHYILACFLVGYCGYKIKRPDIINQAFIVSFNEARSGLNEFSARYFYMGPDSLSSFLNE